jgi:hypothetical protein
MSSCEQLESMTQLIAKEDRNTPEHTQRLYRAGGLDPVHVRRLPTELVQDFGDCLFRRVVVAGFCAAQSASLAGSRVPIITS